MHLRRHKKHDDSYKAVSEAENHLETVQSREEAVQEVSDLFRIMKRENHFAERFRQALGGPDDPSEPRRP